MRMSDATNIRLTPTTEGEFRVTSSTPFLFEKDYPRNPPTVKNNGGAIASALASKIRAKKAIDKYNSNPNLCKSCKTPLLARIGQKLYDVLRKKFCNQSCAASFNNLGKSRYRGASRESRTCILCGDPLAGSRRRYCDECIEIKRSRDTGSISKGALFEKRTGYQSARSQIRRHAETVFNRSGKPRKCSICQYSLHAQIAHLRPVSDFPAEALLKEINAIENLIVLCPNHHWELDNDLLLSEYSWCGAQVAIEVS